VGSSERVVNVDRSERGERLSERGDFLGRGCKVNREMQWERG
jgi:hypothetical protein